MYASEGSSSSSWVAWKLSACFLFEPVDLPDFGVLLFPTEGLRGVVGSAPPSFVVFLIFW